MTVSPNSKRARLKLWLRVIVLTISSGYGLRNAISNSTSPVYSEPENIDFSSHIVKNASMDAFREPENSYITADVDTVRINMSISASFVTKDGIVYAGDFNGRLLRSADAGKTWEVLFKTKEGDDGYRVVFLDSQGNIFACRDRVGYLFRSTDDGKTFHKNLKLSNPKISSCWAIVENKKSWLFASEYAQGDQSERCAFIYRSKDFGETWETVYHNPNARHFHTIAIDPYTGFIYATSGDSNHEGALYRSADDGDHWEILKSGSAKWQFTSMAFTPRYRFFGSDDTQGADIYRTADDENFEIALQAPPNERFTFWAWGRVDQHGNILFGSWTQLDYANPKRANAVIYLSHDEGKTWKKVLDFGTADIHFGTHYASNVAPGGWIYCHQRWPMPGFKIRVREEGKPVAVR
jgi:photosystem II stability/assembly factor-like uncharacterized protein